MKAGLMTLVVATLMVVQTQAAKDTKLIVKTNNPEQPLLLKLEASGQVLQVEKLPLVVGAYVLHFADKKSALEVQSELLQTGDFEYAYAPKKFMPQMVSEPVSGLFNLQQDPEIKPLPKLPNEPIRDPKRGTNWNIPLNGVYDAWEYSKGENVLVAVIDTGIDYNHEDLANNVWRNTGEMGVDTNGADKSSNGIDDDGNGYVDDLIGWDFQNNDNRPWDDHSHGTHVAGIIGALEGNGVGVTGVAPKVKIMALKFLGSGGGTDEDAVKALAYAYNNGAQIINNSWGGYEDAPVLRDAFKALEDKNVLMVIAAGNDAADITSVPVYPARYSLNNGITVAANGTQNQITWWSNSSSIFVHSSSAGYEIHATIPNNEYTAYSGTSMAAPNFAAAAALAWSLRPDLTPQDLRDLFRQRDMFQKVRPIHDPYNGIYTKYTKWRRYSRPHMSIKWLARHPNWRR